jgi:hypothetical protein
MRGSVAGAASVLVAAFLVACTGAEDNCARDADCPAGSRCVENGEHRVCLADGGPGGSGGTGGECPDADGDGVCNDDDLCPAVADPDQADADGDSVGDACDPCPADPDDTDEDGDGRCGAADNCPTVSNPGQQDADADGAGDACDPCPADPQNDTDGDGVCGDADNCPAAANPGQEDADGDGTGDACDACPADPEDDADGDGVCADVDNCPAVPNAGQENLDGDAWGDACDPDVDGDGVAEPDDCAPRDAAVYPGAPDPCDGVDSDCVEGLCALEFSPAAEGWAVRDVTCAAGTRTCAVAVRGSADSGRIIAFELGNAEEASSTILIDNIRGVAIDPLASEGPVFWAVLPQRLAGYLTDGTLAFELEAEISTLAGDIFVSPHRTTAIALHRSASSLQFWSPLALETGPTAPPIQCSSSSEICSLVSLLNLEDSARSRLGIRSPATMTVYQDSETAPARVYVSFTDDTRIAVANISVTGDVLPSSGLLELGSANHAPLLDVTPDGHGLAVIGPENSSWVTTANSAAGHEIAPLYLDSCPTAILSRDSDLLVASHCAGEEPELITLPILDGLPDETAAVTLPLPGCTPIRMAASPRLGDDGPDAVLLGCNDSSTVLVLGRD